MASIESTPSRLVLKDGSTTVTFDKSLDSATLQQRVLLLWSKKPVEFALSDIDDFAVLSGKHRTSGAPTFHSVVHHRSGEVMVLTTEKAEDAEATVRALREFVGLGEPH